MARIRHETEARSIAAEVDRGEKSRREGWRGRRGGEEVDRGRVVVGRTGGCSQQEAAGQRGWNFARARLHPPRPPPHRWMLRVAGPRAWGVSSARDLLPEGVNLLATCSKVFSPITHDPWSRTIRRTRTHLRTHLISGLGYSLLSYPPTTSFSQSPFGATTTTTTTTTCETDRPLSEKVLGPVCWNGLGESYCSSLARDTLQLATIMLAGIFEGNNVREGSFAVGSLVACISPFPSAICTRS